MIFDRSISNLHVVIINSLSALNVDFARSWLKVDSCCTESSVQVPLTGVSWTVALSAPDDDLSLELSGEEAHSGMFDSAGFVPSGSEVFLVPNSVASRSTFDVANWSALGVVGNSGFVSVDDWLIDSGIGWLSIWAVFFQLIRITKNMATPPPR